jgi:hypothetical protein
LWQAFDPRLDEKAVQFSEAGKRANGRNIGAYTLKVIPGLLYSALRCPTTPIEFNQGYVKHVQSHDILYCKDVTIHPKTTASAIPEFTMSMVNLTDPSSPAVAVTHEHLQRYVGLLRGENRVHHAGHGQLEVHAMTLPLKGFDDDTTNAWQGDSVNSAIGDGLTHFACGQTYTAIGRVLQLHNFHLTGLGKLYHFEDGACLRSALHRACIVRACLELALPCPLHAGALVWHDEEIEKILEQHCEALLWWEYHGYFDDEQLARYRVPLARARARKVELDRRRGGMRSFALPAVQRSDLYP